MNIEEVQSLFAARLDVFDPILGQPTNADLTRLREYLTTILLPLPYFLEKEIHNLMGIVLDKDYYKQRYFSNSPKPINPSVYDEMIPNNATNLVQAKAKAVHYFLFAAAKRETRDFVLAFIEDIWVCELQEPITFYTAVSPYELLAHL